MKFVRELDMTNGPKSSVSEQQAHAAAADGSATGWLKLGAVAAASAVLGGLAAAWFYRKTLSRLQDAEDEIPDFIPEITEDGAKEDF
jgi:hypothetical protein